nr:hypothetical protein [uncultured Sphingomonas sp.]
MFDQFVADFLDPIFFPRWFRMKRQLPATFDHGSKRRLSGFDFTALNDWNWGALLPFRSGYQAATNTSESGPAEFSHSQRSAVVALRA